MSLLADAFLGAVISTLHLEGDVPATGGDFLEVPFEVPAGTVEFEIVHGDGDDDTILDFGVWSPDGFRGWGGGNDEPIVIGEAESSRSYLPGPIEPGTWTLVIGKAQLATDPARFTADLTFHDSASLVPRPRAAPEPVVLATGERWYRGDLHVHSTESGDAIASMQEIVDLARERGLDFVVLSDHNTVSQHELQAAFQATVPDVLLVRGAEVTTYRGHGNAVGASAHVDWRVGLGGRTIADVIGDVETAGGLFVVNHPVLDLAGACIGCAWTYEDTPWDRVGALELQTGPYLQSVTLFLGRATALWDEQLDAGHRITAVGGSDDHRAGMDLGANQSPIGTPTTLVWAGELSEAAIVDGIRAGRAIVQLRGPDDPLAELAGPAGERIGDTVTGNTVALEAHVTGGAGMRAALLVDGVEVAHADVDSADWRHVFTAVPRESGSRARLVVSEGNPVVVTNHLWLTWAPAPPADGCGCATGGRGDVPATLLALATTGLALALVYRRRR